jgi:hypothetical protein
VFAATLEAATPLLAAAEAKQDAANTVDKSGTSQPQTLPPEQQTGGAAGPSEAPDATYRQQDLCSKAWHQAKLLQCEPYQKAKQWTLHQSCMTDVYHRYLECLNGG